MFRGRHGRATACLQGGRALGPKGPWALGKPPLRFLLRPLPDAAPEGSSIPHRCQACSSSCSSQSSGKAGRGSDLGKAHDTRVRSLVPAGKSPRCQAKREAGLVLASPTDPAWLRSLAPPSVPVLLDKLCVHLERMHPSPWSDTNPCVSETHGERDVLWAPRAQQVLVMGVIFL